MNPGPAPKPKLAKKLFVSGWSECEICGDTFKSQRAKRCPYCTQELKRMVKRVLDNYGDTLKALEAYDRGELPKLEKRLKNMNLKQYLETLRRTE